MTNTATFSLRRSADSDRALWRRARQGAHRRSRRDPDPGADGAQPQGRLVGARRGRVRLRQPGRRGQPQRGAHGAVAGGHARFRARPHGQSPVRLRPQCHRRRRARHPLRRDRFRHRRRRRVDDAGAAGHGQGAGAVPAQRRNLRHHARLALRQSADQGAIRRRLHGRDRRERGRGIPGLARRPGRLCGALAAARGQGDGGGLFRRGDRPGRSSRRQGRAGQGRQGRASAPGDDARRLQQAQADRAQSRHHHRRQRLGHQRRRGRRDPRFGSRRRSVTGSPPARASSAWPRRRCRRG